MPHSARSESQDPHPASGRRGGRRLLGAALVVALLAVLAFSESAPAADTSQLSVNLTGGGHGAVTSSPAAIDCGDTCRADIDNGTEVTLTATPEPGSIFAGWSGDACSGSSPTCVFTVIEQTSAQAKFTLPPVHLRITRAGTGSGSVVGSLPGIDCSDDCDDEVPNGDPVTLTALAGPGSTFTGWGGACSGSATTCTTQFLADSAVGATFAALPPAPGTGAPTGPLGSPPTAAGPAILVPQPVVIVSTGRARRPSLKGRPQLKGRHRLGGTLVCSRGSWAGIPSAYTFTWRRDGKVVGHGSSHLVRSADRGHALRCDVTARNASGAATAKSASLRISV
jgi:hypothetical protein